MDAFFLAIIFGIVVLASAPVRAQDRSDEIQVGRDLSLRICTACHLVSRDQASLPILRPPAPSFDSIANRQGTTEGTVRLFLAGTHRSVSTPNGMPNPELTDDQSRQVAAFLISLKKNR